MATKMWMMKIKVNGLLFFYFHLPNLDGKLLLQGFLNRRDTCLLWTDINLIVDHKTPLEYKSVFIWLNSKLRVGGKPIYYKTWSVGGVNCELCQEIS